jgi:hypothetical protein
VRRIGDVLEVPTKQLAPSAKILTIVTLMEAHSRASRGQGKLPATALEERSGLSTNTVSAFVQDFAAREGSPINRRVTRDWVTDEGGTQRPITVSMVAPRFGTINESLAAVLSMGGPSEKAQRRAEAARERTAAWGRCSAHHNDVVTIKGYCPECGEVVGERMVRVEDFEALNPSVCDSGTAYPPPVIVRSKRHNLRDSAGPTIGFDDDEDVNHKLCDSPRPQRQDDLPFDYYGQMKAEPPSFQYDDVGDVGVMAMAGGAE